MTSWKLGLLVGGGTFVIVLALLPLQEEPKSAVVRLGVHVVIAFCAMRGAFRLIRMSPTRRQAQANRQHGLPLTPQQERSEESAKWIGFGFLTSASFVMLEALSTYIADALTSLGR